MLSKMKIRVGLGSALGLVIAAAATTAYASPWNHSHSAAKTRSLLPLSAVVVNGTTATKQVSSTIPTNGDLNPYGVAVVPTGIGHLIKGEIGRAHV